MKMICMFLSCRWGDPIRFVSLGEVVAQRKCERCGALSTKAERRWP